jgi:hypothetical protein
MKGGGDLTLVKVLHLDQAPFLYLQISASEKCSAKSVQHFARNASNACFCKGKGEKYVLYVWPRRTVGRIHCLGKGGGGCGLELCSSSSSSRIIWPKQKRWRGKCYGTITWPKKWRGGGKQ